MSFYGRSGARDRSRGTGSEIWSPKMLTDLELRLRADAANVTLNGSTVATYLDTSGRGRHHTQGTAANQPLWVANGIGGRPAIEHVSTDYLDCAAATWGAVVPQPYTIYLVGYIDQSTQRDFTDNVSGADRIIIGTTTSPSPQPFFFAGSSLLAPTQALTSASLIIVTAAAGSASIYVNNSQTAKVTGACGANGIGSMRLGASNTATVPMIGRRAEDIVCSTAHDAATRARVARYVAAWYGLAVA